MRRTVRNAGWLLGATAAALWLVPGQLDGPWGWLPGGPFRGVSEPCPAEGFAVFADVEELELEVRPASPRSITTWSVVRDGELFVPADFLTPWKRWPHQVVEDSRVRVRVLDRIYACRAERVSDAGLIGALREEAARKYGLDRDGLAARTEVWWFRISPRPRGS